MFLLSNGISFNKMVLWWDDVRVAEFTKPSKNTYKVKKINDIPIPMIDKIYFPLNDNSSSSEIKDYLIEYYTITPERVGRRELFSSWVRTWEDEIYDMVNNLMDVKPRRFTFEN